MRRLATMLLFLLGACYETPRPDCAFQCGPEETCPEAYSCGQDGWCHADDGPEAECPELSGGEPDDDDVDAGTPDADPE